jgi:hypothetical protein
MNISKIYHCFLICSVNVILLKGINIHEGYFKRGFSSTDVTCIKTSNGIFDSHQINNDTTLKIKPKKYHNHIYLGLSHVRDNFMEELHDFHYIEYYYPELVFRKYFSNNRFFWGGNFDLRFIIFEDGILNFFSNYYSFVDPLRLEFGVSLSEKKNIYFYMESAPHSILEPNFPPLDVPVFYLSFLKRFKKNINYSLNFGMFLGPDFNKRSIYANTRYSAYRRECLMYGYSIKFLIGFL